MLFFTQLQWHFLKLLNQGHSKSSTHNISEYMIQRVYAHSSNEHFALQKHIERYKGYYTREEKKKA